MNRHILFTLLLPLALLAQPNDTTAPNSILIVSDQDGLEWNVADYLEQYFTNKGYETDNILMSECTKHDYECHGVVILMNVLKNNKIPISLQKKMQQSSAAVRNPEKNTEETIFFISTLSGEEWGPEKRMIDGITSASEMDDAEPIAKRIIKKVEEKLSKR